MRALLILLLFYGFSKPSHSFFATPIPNAPRINLLRDFDEYLKISAAPDFKNIFPFYEGQKTDSSCSLASATMILNASRQALRKGTEKPLTQEEVLTHSPNKEWSRAVIAGGNGLTLAQLQKELEFSLTGHGIENFKVTRIQLPNESKGSLATLQKSLSENELSELNFIIANFDQGLIWGKKSVGHFAPVGAYDAKNRKVLLMDPDRLSYEPYWVGEELLLKAMTGIDSDSGLTRGYLTIQLHK